MDKTRIIFEVIGYVGTALVLISFLMSSVYKLRVINTIGSAISAVYGVLMHVYPTVALNATLAIINIFFLWRHFTDKSEKIYSTKATGIDDGMVRFFIEKYAEEIHEFFPSFDAMNLPGNVAYLIFSEDTLAGVLIGQKSRDGVLDIYLDFVTKTFRDFSVGKFLYRELSKDGVNKCRFLADIPKSYVYLRKVGYKRVGDYMELEL
jgi:hypothetical protein